MPTSPVAVTESGVEVTVWVVPGSSRASIDGIHGDKLKIRVVSPPVGGKANTEVARMLENATGAPFTLIRGMRSRIKVFQVTGTDVDTVRRKLGL